MKISKKNCIMAITAFFICIHISNSFAYKVNDGLEKKVIMLIMNRVDFYDLYSMPQIRIMIDNGSIALMNTRAAGANNEFKSYATIGWGTRAEAAQNTSTFFNIEDNSLATYERRVGDSPPETGVINTNINSLIQQNFRGEYGATPGALGEILRNNGYKTAVFGNSDMENSKLTAAGLIAMDNKGYIDYGNVEDTLIEVASHSPFGIKTNYDLLLNTLKDIYAKSNFIVIETGDTNRLDRYKENLNTTMYQKHKKEVLQNIDYFVKAMMEYIDIDNTLVIIATPYPSDAAALKGERLTPIIIYNGGLDRGLLWSSTTRRTGIIGNVDIAPTILSYFQLTPLNMIGRKMISVESKDSMEVIHQLNKRVVNTSVQRYRVLYSFAVFQMLASALALLTIIFRKRIPSKIYTPISLVLISTIIAPFTLLILPVFGVLNITLNYILLISITGLLVILLHLIGKKAPLNIILYSTLLITVGLMLDIVLGQSLIQNSLLGYDPIIGARYYGIGNEYMGVLIGSTLILLTALMEKYSFHKYCIILLFLGSIIVIAFPTLGANVGGGITATFTYLFTSIRLFGKKITFKKIFYILLLVLVIVGIMSVIDFFFLQYRSHLAVAIEQILTKGPIVIYEIITRKIAMNIRVMGVTVWSRVLLSGMLILGILFYRPVGVIKSIASKYPFIAIGWSGIIVSCIVSFAVNDSGVVAAATTIMFLTTSILYFIMDAIYIEK
ncbi:hypothetical protein SAMN05660297_00382 [Natronincola peptidivorans]|uniref:Alkaline phosphatase n=1 Tax=Natronincola peptidivorans TaxID=426128 RepID=A0A1H9YU08_9FIRM|nr:hypothetical protein [Natronincola peptidivorans]SES72048.1 hypothetical protein SAMN05660297_00382 [Natronincola peptidivorans]